MRRLPNGKHEIKKSYECVIILVCRFNTTIRRSYIFHADCIIAYHVNKIALNISFDQG